MKPLCLYTAQFPYGLGEQFIETEIHYLAAAFPEVFIFPANGSGKQRALPANVRVIQLEDAKNYSTRKGLAALGIWIFDCIGDTLTQRDKKLALSSLLRLSHSAEVLYQFLSAQKLLHAVHYTYWFDDWSTRLSVLASNGMISGYVSRAHRFDLYHDRRKEGFIPYRLFQLKYVSKLVLISQDGKKYMEKHFPQYNDKYELSYLGVENNLPFKAEVNTNPQYLVVSCSRMVDIKRVDLMVKSLAQIKHLPIKWVHFGGGELFEEVKKMAEVFLPGNIEWELKGMIANTDVLEYYRNNAVDLFLNLSMSEGLPVSIMEVVSYGIPVLATDVGGTKEIVNSITGKLVPSEINPNDVAHEIASLLNTYSRDKILRERIYQFWNSNFNSQVNYLNFTQLFDSLD